MSRPGSTLFTTKPPLMHLAEDTPAELQRIFSYMNSHANKLYLEGYFLKLNDLDTSRFPSPVPKAPADRLTLFVLPPP